METSGRCRIWQKRMVTSHTGALMLLCHLSRRGVNRNPEFEALTAKQKSHLSRRGVNGNNMQHLSNGIRLGHWVTSRAEV